MRGRYAAPQMSLTNAMDVKAVHNILGEKTPPKPEGLMKLPF